MIILGICIRSITKINLKCEFHREVILLKFLKRFRCNHDFQLIDTYVQRYIDEYGLLKDTKILYCLKCEKEKHVYAEEYKRKKMMKKIKNEYQKEKERNK